MTASDGLMAKVKQWLGWATGDRRVEAEGKLDRLDDGRDERDDHRPGDRDQVLDRAEDDVRRDYGEYRPELDGEEPASPAEHDRRQRERTRADGALGARLRPRPGTVPRPLGR